MKKVISLVLALALFAGTLTLMSCAMADEEYSGAQNNASASDTTSNKPPYYTKLPDPITFDGAKIRFALASAHEKNLESDGYRGCYVDEDNGEMVVSAVYKRNQNVEERLNVDIDVVLCTDEKSLTKTVTPIFMAGDDDIDCLWADRENDIGLCLKGYLLDLNKLDKNENYIEYDSDWWNSEYSDNIRYKDELFWLSGPLSLTFLGGLSCVFVNRDLYDQYLLADYGDITDMVLSGQWNVASLAKMSNDIYTKTGKTVFGSKFADKNAVMDALIGAGLEYTKKNADGSISLDLASPSSKYLSVSSQILQLFTSVDGVGSFAEFGDGFAGGTQLFKYGKLSDGIALREMKYDCYILPTPKLGADQAEYRSAVSSRNQLIGIPYTCQNVPAVSATIEAMAAEAYRLVMPAYFDLISKYKFTRDDDTAMILDLIRDSAYTDFGMAWEREIFGSDWISSGKFKFDPTTLNKYSAAWAHSLKEALTMLDDLQK